MMSRARGSAPQRKPFRRTRLLLLGIVLFALFCTYLSVTELKSRVAASLQVKSSSVGYEELFKTKDFKQIETLAVKHVEDGWTRAAGRGSVDTSTKPEEQPHVPRDPVDPDAGDDWTATAESTNVYVSPNLNRVKKNRIASADGDVDHQLATSGVASLHQAVEEFEAFHERHGWDLDGEWNPKLTKEAADKNKIPIKKPYRGDDKGAGTDEEYDLEDHTYEEADKRLEEIRLEKREAECAAETHQLHSDYWGDPVVWGDSNKKDDAGACCQHCYDYRPNRGDMSAPSCNVWVYCGDEELCGSQYKECWLKHLAFPTATKPTRGPKVGWTAGSFVTENTVLGARSKRTDPHVDRSYHVVTSAQGTSVHWQVRIHYYHYLKQRRACQALHGAGCHMGGFTRLLHSGEPDELMREIPTVVVDPLPDDTPGANKGYVVLNRPYAFVQWVKKASIPERYILMSEPDHIFLVPYQNPMLGERIAAFPFFYIEPAKKEHKHITEKFTGPLTRKWAESIPPIGSSPTFISMDDMKTVAPVWMDLALEIFNDDEAHSAWGWVLEMYAFTIATYKAGVLPVDFHLDMAAQPPWDTEMEYEAGKPYAILHYTYGMDYSLNGTMTAGIIGEWRFDKRSLHKPPQLNMGDPPDGMQNDLVRHLIKSINEATSVIPGWEQYSQSGKATQFWDGTTFAE